SASDGGRDATNSRTPPRATRSQALARTAAAPHPKSAARPSAGGFTRGRPAPRRAPSHRASGGESVPVGSGPAARAGGKDHPPGAAPARRRGPVSTRRGAHVGEAIAVSARKAYRQDQAAVRRSAGL